MPGGGVNQAADGQASDDPAARTGRAAAAGGEDEPVAPRRFKGFLFDMDGVLYRGRHALPGARSMLAGLARAGVPFALVTNNSTRTPRQYVRHLAALGVRARANQIVTSSIGAAAYLRERLRAGSRVLVIGERGVRHAVEQAGFTVVWERAAAVVVGLDRRLTYRKLARATDALVDGALFVACNPDPLLPTEHGVIPGTGASVEALAYAAGRRPIMIGKPEPALLRDAMVRIGTKPSETVMVGDQVMTDIAAGRAAGTFTVLVRSNVYPARRAPAGAPRPDVVVRDLRELWRWAGGCGATARPRRRVSGAPSRSRRAARSRS
jgi:4-nitrophenyl phosphatase